MKIENAIITFIYSKFCYQGPVLWYWIMVSRYQLFIGAVQKGVGYLLGDNNFDGV